MTVAELDVLARAHALFAGESVAQGISPIAGTSERNQQMVDGLPQAYRAAARRGHADFISARDSDARLVAILRRAREDQLEARQQTRAVLDAARAEAGSVPVNPVAQRELVRRKAARLRAQQSHVLAAKRRAARRRTAIAALRYRLRRYKRDRIPLNSRAAVAVRAALSRLGCPYVWGATGPDRFDCSGLVQWAYSQAGVPLTRTTYDQIHEGIPVPRSQVQPGDLVFPHAGHVQLAIGDNLVVEAPHAGATVRISPLGTNVTIRRPVS